MQRVRVQAVCLRVRQEVPRPRFEIRKREQRFDVVDDNAGELDPVLRAEVDALPFEDVVDRVAEVVRVHERNEVTHLIDPIRLVEVTEPLELVVRYVELAIDPVSGDFDGVGVQERPELASQVGHAPATAFSRVEGGFEEAVEQRTSQTAGLLVDLRLGPLHEDVRGAYFVRVVLGVAGSEGEIPVPRRFGRLKGDEKASPGVGTVFKEADRPPTFGRRSQRGAGGGLQITVDT